MPDLASGLEWSPDGSLLLIEIKKRQCALVKSLHDADFHCKIDEGLAGLASARWGPTSASVITVADFKIRLTIWSLADKSVQYIRAPKHSDRGLAFSKGIMALAERVQDTDSVGLYDTAKPWTLLHRFSPDTFDLEDVRFSADGANLVVTDSPLRCKLSVFRLAFTKDSVSAQLLARFTPYPDNTQLGLRTLTASPQYLAGGYFDNKLRIFSQLSWKEIFAFDHDLDDITDANTPTDVNIYVESAEGKDGGSVYEIGKKPFKLPLIPAH